MNAQGIALVRVTALDAERTTAGVAAPFRSGKGGRESGEAAGDVEAMPP